MAKPIRFHAAAFATAFALAAHAQGDFLVPPANLVLDGVPPIPAEVAAKTAPYTAFKPGTLLDWHPKRREILVRMRQGNADQLHRVAEPGATPEPLTDHADPVSAGRYEPRAGSWLLFTRGTGGDEVYRIHRLRCGERADDAREPGGAPRERAGAGTARATASCSPRWPSTASAPRARRARRCTSPIRWPRKRRASSRTCRAAAGRTSASRPTTGGSRSSSTFRPRSRTCG